MGALCKTVMTRPSTSSTSMEQHHQEESEGRQTEVNGEGLIMTVSHNFPNKICEMSELKKLTGVKESFCGVNFYILSIKISPENFSIATGFLVCIMPRTKLYNLLYSDSCSKLLHCICKIPVALFPPCLSLLPLYL